MTLSFSNLNEIGNLYENIAAYEQEQLNEDLNDKIKRGLTNQAFGNKPTSPTTPLNLNPGSGDASSLIKTGLDSVKKPTPKPMSFGQTLQTNRAFGNAWNEIRAGKKETQTTQQPRIQQQTPNTQTSAAAKPQTVAAAGGKGGTVTAGKQYAATLGGQKGNVTYDASGAKKFTPSASTPAKTLPSVNDKDKNLSIWAQKNKGMIQKVGTSDQKNILAKSETQKSFSAPAAPASSTLGQAVSAAKPQTAFTPKTPAATSSVGSFKPVNSLQATNAAGSTKAPDTATLFSQKTAAALKPITPNPSASTSAGNFTKKEGDGLRRKPGDELFEGVDVYDLVLEYLLDNGHVDTVEEANYVMMEMDAETIGNIVEDSATLSASARKRAEEMGRKRRSTKEYKQGLNRGTGRNERAAYNLSNMQRTAAANPDTQRTSSRKPSTEDTGMHKGDYGRYNRSNPEKNPKHNENK